MLAKDVSVNDLLYRQYEFSKDVRSLQQLVVSYIAYSSCHMSETFNVEIFCNTILTHTSNVNFFRNITLINIRGLAEIIVPFRGYGRNSPNQVMIKRE